MLFVLFLVAVVVTDVTKKNVTEGGDIQACVTLNAVSVRDVTVVLTSEDKMATGEIIKIVDRSRQEYDL